jgi:hypothetical protein
LPATDERFTMTDAPDLATAAEARELLGDDDFLDLVSDGTVRRVRFGDGAFYMGADIDKALRERDPRYLARLVRDGADSDDPESARNLAAGMPRL